MVARGRRSPALVEHIKDEGRHQLPLRAHCAGPGQFTECSKGYPGAPAFLLAGEVLYLDQESTALVRYSQLCSLSAFQTLPTSVWMSFIRLSSPQCKREL